MEWCLISTNVSLPYTGDGEGIKIDRKEEIRKERKNG
jgi:hypothetical protein